MILFPQNHPFDSQKKTIVFLSGNLISPSIYDNIFLPTGFNRIYVDYLKSYFEDIDQVADAIIEQLSFLGVQQFYLVGHSAGGVIAISLLSRYANQIYSAILSNTGVNTLEHGAMNFPKQLQDNYRDEEYILQFLQSCFLYPLSYSWKKKLLIYAKQANINTAIQLSTSLRKKDYSLALQHYYNPLIIAHGIKDKRRTLSSVNQIKNICPQTKVFLIDAGHTPMIDNPKAYQQAFQLFIS